jgi:hypothetical protein
MDKILTAHYPQFVPKRECNGILIYEFSKLKYHLGQSDNNGGGGYDYDTDTREGTINLLEEGADDDGSDLSIFLHFKDAEMLRKMAMQLNKVADWMDGADA